MTAAQQAAGKQLRFTDTRLDEQARAMSIKMMPMSLVMESHSGKSFLLNLLDCPGHVNFNDEVWTAGQGVGGDAGVVERAGSWLGQEVATAVVRNRAARRGGACQHAWTH